MSYDLARIREATLPIRHCVLGVPGASIERARVVHEHLGHALAIIDIHLTAESADEELARHDRERRATFSGRVARLPAAKGSRRGAACRRGRAGSGLQ